MTNIVAEPNRWMPLNLVCSIGQPDTSKIVQNDLNFLRQWQNIFLVLLYGELLGHKSLWTL